MKNSWSSGFHDGQIIGRLDRLDSQLSTLEGRLSEEHRAMQDARGGGNGTYVYIYIYVS